MENQSKTYYPGLDIIKYIMAILIVAAHCNLFVENERLYDVFAHVTEIAVPTFFCISAYLFFSKLLSHPEEQKSIFLHTIIRLAIFFAVWYVLMLPYSYIHVWQYANFNQFLVLIPFGCAFSGYWFIKALIFNTAIVYFIQEKKLLLFGAIVASAVYLFFGYDYLYGNLGKALHPYFCFYYHTYSFIFGAIIACYRDSLPSLFSNKKALFSVFLLTMALSLCSQDFRVIAKLLYPIELLLLALQMNGFKNAEMLKSMRIHSILYYVLQFIMIFGYNYLFPEGHSVVRFLVIIAILFLFSQTIIFLEHYRSFCFLKYLH